MPSANRPNVLIFMPHDLGDWISCYDHPTVTSPNLDRFASQGVQLANYFAAAPECTPSRGCMYTGLHCHQNGLMGLSNFGWSIRPTVKHLATHLRDAGYRTHLFGIQHETSQPPETLGYETATKPTRNVSDVCDDLADFFKAKGDAQSDAGSDEPWFAQAAFFNTHRVWPKAVDNRPQDMAPPGWLPDTPAIREDLADFHDDITRMDTAIGRALDALDEAGLAENTIVIFTSDHGLPFPRAKATLYDPGLRIPMLIRWPAGFEGSRKLPELTSNVDLTPTLLELVGHDTSADFAGRSFAPLLRNQPYQERESVHATLYYDVAYDPMHMVRTKSHKYLRSFAVTDEDRAAADPRVLASHPKGIWVRVDDFDVLHNASARSLKVDCSRPPAEELYDLEADPDELNNLADSPEAADVLADMRKRLDAWMHETDSPLLHGHVAPNEAQCKAAENYRYGGPMYADLR